MKFKIPIQITVSTEVEVDAEDIKSAAEEVKRTPIKDLDFYVNTYDQITNSPDYPKVKGILHKLDTITDDWDEIGTVADGGTFLEFRLWGNNE